MAKINGENVKIPAGTTVEQYLLDNGYAISRIALERNGEILPKSGYGSTVLCENDVIEIVSFVGGG
ncbi:MAG: sulfur carrier protein ThiS [Clostridia bacterium]